MTRRLLTVMVLLTGVVSVALAIPLAIIVSQDQKAAFVSELEVYALSTASALASQPPASWDVTIDSITSRFGGRVVVVDNALQLVADTDDSGLDRSFDRPEIQQALQGSLASDIRASSTLGIDLRYVAAPVIQDQRVVAAVRLSLPEDLVTERIRQTQFWLAVFVIAVMVMAALVAWILARGIAAPLLAVANVAADLPDDLGIRADEQRGPAEVRAVARALNHTAERLAQLLQRAQAVAAEASHHLRTPLTGIRLRIEAIEETASDAEVVKQAEAALTEVDRLTRRVEQILALARGDAKAHPLEVVDIAAVLRDRVSSVQPVAGDRGITVQVRSAPQAWAMATAGSVARCIDELLANAVTYARTCITADLEAGDASVVLTIRDDGPGIDPGDEAVIWGRFQRGHGAVPGGSGLGLALVRESVEDSGGSVELSTQPGAGLTVTLRWAAADGTSS